MSRTLLRKENLNEFKILEELQLLLQSELRSFYAPSVLGTRKNGRAMVLLHVCAAPAQ